MKTLQVECRKALNSCSLLRSDPAGLLGKHREVALARLGSGGVDGDPSYGEDLCDHGSRKGCGQRGKGLAEHAGINGRRFGILEAPGGRSAVQGGAVRCGPSRCHSRCPSRRALGGRVRATPALCPASPLP